MPKVPLPQIGQQTPSSPAYGGAEGTAQIHDIGGRFATQLGQVSSEFGQGVAQAARVMQDQIDDARVTEGFTKWADRTSDVLSGENGYLYSEGKDARGYYRAKALGEIEKSWREIEQGMENDVQRGMFREAVQKHMIGVKERVYGHEAEQLRIDNIGQADALRKQAARTASEAYMNRALNENARVSAAAAESLATGQEPQSLRGMTYEQAKKTADEFTVQLNTAVGQAHRIADLKGWKKNDPRREELVLNTTTMIHASVFDQLIARGKTQQAKDYVAKLDDSKVESDTLTKMQETVRRASVNDNGARVAAEITAGSDQLVMGKMAAAQKRSVANYEVFGGEAYQLGVAEIEKRFASGKLDADERRVALAEFEATHNRRRQMWADRTRETQEAAERLLLGNKDLRIDSAEFPPQLFNDLVKYGRLNEAAKLQGGVPRTTSAGGYAAVLKAVDDGRLRGMSYSDLYNEFYGRLSEQHWDELKQFHAALNSQKAVPHTTVFSDGDRMKLIAYNSGVIKNAQGPKGDAEEKRNALFQMEVQRRINQLEAKGVKVTDELLQQIGDTVAQEPKVFLDVDWGSDQKVSLWEVPEKDRSKVYVENLWGESTVYMKSGNDAVEGALTRFFKDRGLPEPEWQKLAWLSKKIPYDKVQTVLQNAVDAVTARAILNGHGTGNVAVAPEDIKDAWLTIRAAEIEAEKKNIPIWKQQGYPSEFRWRAGQRWPR